MKLNLFEEKTDLEVQITKNKGEKMEETLKMKIDCHLIKETIVAHLIRKKDEDPENIWKGFRLIQSEFDSIKDFQNTNLDHFLQRLYLSIPELEKIEISHFNENGEKITRYIDKNSNPKVLISLSGGLDSTTLLYYLINKGAKIEAISFNYGSKHNDIEIEYAKKTCEKLNINHHIIELDFINKYFKSDLLQNGGAIPEGHYQAENMKSTVVPFRNGIFLSISAGIAESYDCEFIALASHSGDHAIYPDCRPIFTKAMFEAIKYGTEKEIYLIAPFNEITKTDIVKLGNKLNVDFSLTYSCYNGREKHCGKCGTCIERKEAFAEAKVLDPTIYEE